MPAVPALVHAFATLVILCGIAFGLQTSAWAATPHVVELRIAHRAVIGPEVSRGQVVRVTEGEEVEIRWRSDEDAILHFHGYDIMTPIVAGGEAVTRFEAKATGRFPIETHSIGADQNVHIVLIYVEVYPR